jgi:hypothetical protein
LINGGTQVAWRCESCDRLYWSAEEAVECCQPEVKEIDDDQAMDCPTCGGEGNVNPHTEHDVDGKPFEASDECGLCLGSGVVLKSDVERAISGPVPVDVPAECPYCGEPNPIPEGRDRCPACLDWLEQPEAPEES